MFALKTQRAVPTKHEFKQLRLDGVSRHFGHAAALDTLSLTIERGEFVALLGPSGCGKSTALNCLAGLLQLSAGSIWLDQQRIDVLPPERRGFGMVFQNYALFPHLSVRANIAFGLKMRGMSSAEIAPRVAKVLELVQLHAHADKLPGQLSGGQQQRVAIARAIVIEPPLVLMDEPLSNLDAKLRLEMRSEIRRIHRTQGCSTIYVTHDQDEALSLADRIVVMKLGVVQQVGTPQQIYAQPANLKVARFMGYRNVLPLAVVSRTDGSVQLKSNGIELAGIPMQGLNTATACVAMRPEEISLGEGPNPLQAVVESAEYCGRDWLVEASIGSNDTRLLLRANRSLAIGERVPITVAPGRVLAYPAED
jgi:putative spermidine/putrescine transport system ATP-binding protein